MAIEVVLPKLNSYKESNLYLAFAKVRIAAIYFSR